jgi:hypothetical protein
MQMKKIILISGLAQHGKDSTAQFLKNKLQGRTLILHNADYLKYIAVEYLKWNGEKDINGRTLLQSLGTERVRMELKRPLFWIEKSCDVIEILYDHFDHFIIPDTRYRNEIYYPQARFPNQTMTIRVHRLNFESELTEEQKNHISETELVSFPHDFDIYSESGLNKLEQEVNEFLYNYSIL